MPVAPPDHEPPGWAGSRPAWRPDWGPSPDFRPSSTVVARLRRDPWVVPGGLSRARARVDLAILGLGTALLIITAEIAGGVIGPPVVGFTLDGDRFVRGVLVGLAAQWVFTLLVLALVRPGVGTLGLRPERLRQHLGWGALGAAAMLVVASTLGMLLAKLTGSPDDGFITDVRNPPALGVAIGLAAAVSVTAALSEEVVFRALLLGRLHTAGVPPLVAIGLSAAVFGALHYPQGAVGIAVVTVLGGILAIMLVLRRSLVAGIVAHFLYDVFVLVLLALAIGA